MLHKFVLGIALGAALSAWPAAAQAQDDASKEAIRSLANEAAADYELAEYQAAKTKFASVYAMAKVPKLAVWLARTNEKLGQLVSAQALYKEALSLQPNELWRANAQQEAQKEAQAELEKLLPRIPTLTFTVEAARPEEVSLTIDGVAVSNTSLNAEHFVDPGARQITAQRGPETVNETVTLAEGDRKSVVLAFRPAAPSAPAAFAPMPPPGGIGSESASTLADDGDAKARRQRTLGWVGVSVGAAGLALGATTGILVGTKYGDLKSECPNHSCGPENASDVDSYQTLRTVSTIGFIAGGVIGAAGVTLLLTSPKQTARPTAGLWVSPGMAGVNGRF